MLEPEVAESQAVTCNNRQQSLGGCDVARAAQVSDSNQTAFMVLARHAWGVFCVCSKHFFVPLLWASLPVTHM
jgi:hypothetical protein